MKLSWLRLGDINQKRYTTYAYARLHDIVELVFINANNIKIDRTIFNEYLDYENILKSTDSSAVLQMFKSDALFDCKLFETYFIFCINSFINKSITIRCPFTKNIISTDEYFILNEEGGFALPRSICNYYFKKEQIILGITLGVSGTTVKSGGGPMHIGFVYAIDLRNKHILEASYSQYNLNTNSIYFKSLINTINNYTEYIESPKSITVFGFQYNIGHTMMNNLTGLFLLDTYNVLTNIDTVFIGNSDIFDGCSIFKTHIKDIQYRDNLNELNGIWKKGVCLVYDHFFMSMKFNEYVRNHFNRYNNSLDVVDIINIKNTYYPILNIVLRCGTYCLVNQEDTFIDIINKLTIKYPNIFILFDGFCGYSKDTRTIKFNTINYNNMQDEYHTVVKNITNQITTNNYKSLIGMPFYDIIKYTDIANASIYQIGSGGTLTGNISKKNGIYFGRVDSPIFNEINKIIIENPNVLEYIDNVYVEYDGINISNINTNIIIEKIEKYF